MPGAATSNMSPTMAGPSAQGSQLTRDDRDLFKWFETAPAPKGANRADIIFLDPPYRFLNERPEALRKLAGQLVAHLAPSGLVVFRHDAKDSFDLAPLREVDRREYGGMIIKLLTVSDPT